LTNLFSDDPGLSDQDKAARRDLLTTLGTGMATALDGNAATAENAAFAALDNNFNFNKALAEAKAAYAATLAKTKAGWIWVDGKLVEPAVKMTEQVVQDIKSGYGIIGSYIDSSMSSTNSGNSSLGNTSIAAADRISQWTSKEANNGFFAQGTSPNNGAYLIGGATLGNNGDPEGFKSWIMASQVPVSQWTDGFLASQYQSYQSTNLDARNLAQSVLLQPVFVLAPGVESALPMAKIPVTSAAAAQDASTPSAGIPLSPTTAAVAEAPSQDTTGTTSTETKVVDTSNGSATSATYGPLKNQLYQENLANIAKADPRLAQAIAGSGSTNPNFSIGTGTAAEADQLGNIWVGDGARATRNGLVSADGTLVYRAPVLKSAQGYPAATMANFEQYTIDTVTGVKTLVNNGHLTIVQ
jgi:hypothetical protein